jgi:hypothetical protein
MKMSSWILSGLLLLALSIGAWAVPGMTSDGRDDDFAIAQMPHNPGGSPFGSTMRGGPGWMEQESPELVSLVRDIAALRQINRADLSAKQIRDILPVLRALKQQQNQMLIRVKKNLQTERARLLKAQGPDNTKGQTNMGESAGDYRKNVETTQAKISKLLSAAQAKIINDMIAPPRFALEEARTSAPNTRKEPSSSTSNRERLQELRQNRFGGGHASVEMSRLISLLQEKQKALAK